MRIGLPMMAQIGRRRERALTTSLAPSSRPLHPGRVRPAASSARLRALGGVLDGVRAGCDVQKEREKDPVKFVHRYADLRDRELVALLASALAFGNVKALCAKIEDALDRIGPGIARAADDPAALRARLRGWKHRVYRDEDLTCLLIGARRVQQQAGSLGEALARELARAGTLREALAAWTGAIRREGGLDRESGRRGGAHILADPAKGSAVKRLMLLLRWMARPADGIDLGLWPLIPPAMLLIPVDTHIHKLGKNLGLTRRNDVSWKTAEEITASLRRFDPQDPVKYDFSLCHLGMNQRCSSRRDPARCEGCEVKSVCRHWANG
jgi:uncharacterized protein (TIGR02757 family)